MKKTISLCLLAMILFMADVDAQKREVRVSDFNEVSFGIPGRLYITQGNTNSVEIDCSDDAYDRIEIEERGDKLVIRNRDRGWNWRGWRGSNIDVYVTMKDIEGITVSGSGNVVGENVFRTDDLYLSVSGSGDMDIEADAKDMEMRVSGSGSISMAGSGDDLEVKISGSGRVKAEDLEVRSLDASISGSGSIYITAEEEIYARISGSGSVYYKGDPDRVQSNSSGSGKIRRL